MSDWLRRDVPQLYNAYELEPTALTDAALLSGLEARVLSSAGDRGDVTCLVDIPAGWRHTEDCEDATFEIFVVEGGITVNGEQLGVGGFAALPRGSGQSALESPAGAVAFVFLTRELDGEYYYGGSVHLARARDLPWQMTNMPGACQGILHKSLRVPDPAHSGLHGGPSGMIRLVLMVPSFGECRQEIHHESWEEIFFLTGEFFMPERGLMGPGTCLANPCHLRHGPLITQHGSYMLVHTDGPQDSAFRHTYPAGKAFTDEYLDTASLLAPPKTVAWSEMPEYEQWRRLAGAGADGLEWPRYADPSIVGG